MDPSDRPLSRVLHHAIAAGDFNTVQTLLEKGIDADSPLIARSPFSIKSSYSKIDVNSIKSMSDVNSINSKGDINSISSYSKIDVNSIKSMSDINSINSKGDMNSIKSYSKKDVNSIKNMNEVNSISSKCDIRSIISKSDANSANGKNDADVINVNNNTDDDPVDSKINVNIKSEKGDVRVSWVGYTSRDSSCYDSMRETPIIESDDEGSKADVMCDSGVTNHTCHGTHCNSDYKNDIAKASSPVILSKRTPLELYDNVETPDTSMPNNHPSEIKVDESNDKVEIVVEPYEEIERAKSPAEIKIVESYDNVQISRDGRPISYIESEQEISEESYDNHLSIYCDGVERPLSYVVPLNQEGSLSDNILNRKSIAERLNDNNETLIERTASVLNKEEDELLIEEKPLKLIPRIRRKLSRRWVKEQKREVEKRDPKLCGMKPRNVDNEQLDENYDGLALFEAVQNGMDMIVQTLLETGNNYQLNLADENGFSPLMQAAWHGQTDCLKVLLDHGANTTLRNTTGCTAMHFAAARGHPDCLQALIDHESRIVNFQTKFGATPLILASKGGYIECVDIILQNGADVNSQYRGNQNSLLFAAGNGHYECVKLLIDNDIELDQGNSQGVTPLMRAIQQGHNQCVQLLCEKESDVNLQDIYGRTPVHFAIEYDNPEALKILLKSGASIELKTKGDSSPLDYAEKFENTKCEEILEMHEKSLKEKILQEKEVEKNMYKEQNEVTCFLCFFFHRSPSKSSKKKISQHA